MVKPLMCNASTLSTHWTLCYYIFFIRSGKTKKQCRECVFGGLEEAFNICTKRSIFLCVLKHSIELKRALRTTKNITNVFYFSHVSSYAVMLLYGCGRSEQEKKVFYLLLWQWWIAREIALFDSQNALCTI